MIDLAEPQRQSPLAILFFGLKLVRRIGIVQVGVGLLFLWNTLLAGSLTLLVLLTGAALSAFGGVSWWRSTFQVVDGELVVRSGVVRADRLTVPLDRIQSISIEQEPLHRVVGLVKVSVDSAGSDGAEFEIAAVTREVAEALERAAVTDAPRPSPVPSVIAPARVDGPESEPDEVVFTHGWRRLVRTALTTWPLSGLVLLAPLFAFGDEIGDFLFGEPIDGLVRSVPLRGVPLLLAACILVAVALNVVRILLTDWALTLRATSARVQRTSGLLSRTSRASSVERIQMVSSRQNLLQRRAGLYSVTLSTIGHGDLDLNGCSGTELDDIRRRVRVAAHSPHRDDRRVDPATAWPAVCTAIVVVAAFVVGLWFAVGPWALLATGLIAPSWAAARRAVSNQRWSIGDELASERRLLSTDLDQALVFKANAVVVTQTIFERRRALARIRLVTAAGSIEIGMIPLDEAQAVRDVILVAASTDRRPWM
ncbi:MAG: PH domain-containing protein [Ilumatobacter sp.]|uniref:PH domain-containing protein n=1 Tax=Ilumatobacter sp. TaxID=1967498 RepID=UPI00329936AD